MKRLLTAGIFGTILGIVGAGTAKASIVSSGFLDEKLTEYALSTSLDLKANQTDLTALSNKIGTLPDDITVSEMLTSTWKTNGTRYPGLSLISENIRSIELAYNTRFPDLFLNGVPSTTIDGVDYTGPVYPLWKLSEGIDKVDSIETKIGDLPTEIPNTDSIWDIFGFAERGTPIDLPDTIGGMFAFLFDEATSYNGPSLASIMAKILIGFNKSGNSNARIEGLSNLTSVYNLIGDSPIVTAVNSNATKIGTVPDGKNLAGMIGTLPDGYDSVGAALTAIKGIAEDAKAAALAAIPDPKQEGSSGKFVLTVDIVGDNATYHWEKIDREGETTTE